MMANQKSYEAQVAVLPSPILHRATLVQALVNALEQHTLEGSSHYKLILLCASAGYGKTTLLVDAVSRISSICCWSLLSENDKDLSLFLRKLLTSIQQNLPSFGSSINSLLDNIDTQRNNGSFDTLSIIDHLLDAFRKEITQPFVLVFFDFHTVRQDGAIAQFVGRLIANLPPQGTIVIESRATPNLALASLIASGQMYGIGSDDLRFSPQEVYDLAHLQGITTLSLWEAEKLANAYQGWIAGILLGSRFKHAPFLLNDESFQPSAYIDNSSHLLAYLKNEVFKYEMPTLAFLQETSILACLVPKHCDALLQTEYSAARLAYAEQKGLFVTRVRTYGDMYQSKAYVCHPVLRQLFMLHLKQQEPERYIQLQHHAAQILRADQQMEQALEHAYQAQDYTVMIEILLENNPFLVYEEHSEQLLDWLQKLPEEQFHQQPQLLLMASNIYLRQGEFSQVPMLLTMAEKHLNTMSTEQDRLSLLRMQAELDIARSHLLFFQGDFQQAQELCQQALQRLPPHENKLRIRAYQHLGTSLIVGTGQVQEGITQLQQALQISKSQQNEQQIAILHRLIANAYSWISKQALAEYHQKRAFGIWKKLNNPQGIIYSMNSMGLLKMRQGLIQQAEELLNQALHESREVYAFKSGEAYALLALGELHNSLGQHIEALNHLEDALNIARQCEDRYLICCTLCNLAISYVFLGDVQTAQFFLDQVLLREGERTSFEGLLFHLTQGTVFLEQQDYEQAEAILHYTANAARQVGIQIISIRVLFRLAACYIEENKYDLAQQTGREILTLNQQGDFDFFYQTELRRYNKLQTCLDQLKIVSVEENPPVLILEQETQSFPLTGKDTLEGHNLQNHFSLQAIALGEPKVIFNDIPITRWRMVRAMELFFFLLENRRPVRKSQIIDALWPKQDSDQLESTVRTIIYYLRKALGEKSIIFKNGLYRLNLAALGGADKIWYDVAVFEEHYMQASKALEAGDDETARTAFNKMIELYHGDYMQSSYNEWCIFHREKLRQAFMDAHQQLALIAWREEEWERSLHHWQSLLIHDSCDETAHYNIMRCYLQQGKRELALRQFQRCTQELQKELNIAPGASLQKLYQSIIE